MHTSQRLRTLLIICAILFALAIVGLSLMARLATQDNDEGQVIKIGLIAPLTGSNQAGGASMVHGVRLAVENINKLGGIKGREVVLTVYDDADDPAKCLEATKQLIFIDNVKAIIGPFSSRCATEIYGHVNSCGIPLILPVAMDDSLNQENDYVFRSTLGVAAAQTKINGFVDERKGQYILLEGFKAKTIGIIFQDDLWGTVMYETVLADLERLDRVDALTFAVPFALGQSEFSLLYDKEKEDFPDIIYVISSGSESVPLVKEGRDAGFTGIFIGEGGFNSAVFDETLGAYADGCVFSTQWHPSFSTPMSDVFLKEFKAKYEAVPDMFAALSYESMYLLRDSLNHVIGSLGEDDFSDILRNDLSKMKIFSGLSGPIYYNEFGQADRDVFILQKRWDGNKIQAFIIYPTNYSQNSIKWNFELSD